MLHRSKLLLALAPVIAVSLATFSFAAETKEQGAKSSRLLTYEKSTGERCFALSLAAPLGKRSPAARDVVILVDTSASQTGKYREDAHEGLKSLLTTLDPKDRVKLYAVDLFAEPLTSDFVGPHGDLVKAAVKELERRVPLGSTDMLAALQAAADSFAGDSQRPRSVVYIGDGLSRANWLSTDEFKSLVDNLVQRRVTVSSYAIGPHRDAQFLAAVANQTGGILFVDTNKTSGLDGGAAIGASLRTPVAWPISANLPAAMKEVFPANVPPLRGDRDSILVGTLDQVDSVDVSVEVEVEGERRTLSWSVVNEGSHADMTFLPQLVEAARADKGLTLPTVGSAGLKEAGRVLTASARGLSMLSGQALASGNRDSAKKLAEAALRRDPTNPEAIRVRKAVEEERVEKADDGDAPDGDLRLINRAGDGGALAEFESGEGRFLKLIEDERAVFTDKIRTQIEEGLTDARNRMGVDAEGAKDDLKLLLEMVDRAVDLDTGTRAELRDQLESAIQEAGTRAIEQAEARTLAEQTEAEGLERQRLVEQASRGAQKLKQLMARFNSLLAEGRYAEAEDDIAIEIRKTNPRNPVGESVLWYARLGGNVEKNMVQRDHRHRKYIDMLWQVELSHTPFPDEPPIIYPPAEVWEKITLDRQKYRAVDLTRPGGAEEKIFKALDDDTQIEFIDTPLIDVIDYLEDYHGIQIELKTSALDAVGLGSDTPVTRDLKGISLRSALRLMLSDMELTYVVQDEVLQITTPEDAEQNLVTKVYPVGDLVLPISNQAGANPFQLGGGLGGQGGFGGGLGGGRRGGFGGGGGGGGFGGGLGGGGFGGGFMAVEDDLRLGGSNQQNGAGSTSAEDASATGPRKAKAIELSYGDLPADQAWDNYFAKTKADLPAVRQTVRELMERRKFDDVIAMLRAALRNGQPQPWMYEALALAMEARNAVTGTTSKDEKRELERTLMSAIDFAEDIEDVLIAASFMARFGLDERALSLFREVSQANPSRIEPYVEGLNAAKRLDDVDGIRWATVGIISHAWPKDKQEIYRKAVRTAAALLLRLKRENRLDEAREIDAELSRALARDCIVKITWTGDADVDMSVEEPTGTFCSLQNPRSTSGGVLLGDSFSYEGAKPVEGFSEIYVCPKGFEGQYRVFLRRIWGQVAGGKVTVDVITNYRTKDEQRMRRQIPLSDKDAIVLFDLNSGRRTEPLEEEQVATAARNQMAISRSVLIKQLNSVEDSMATQSYVSAQRRAVKDGRILNRGGGGLARRGVGYRPVITTLPQGVNMTSTAVISADRRYVRITATPLFSAIGDVTTFNFSTGETGTGN